MKMTKVDVVPAPARRATHLRHMLAVAILAAFVIRSALFGNELYGEDEQFYALFADQMLRGAIPYIDIWDRKPFGLFLLIAALRAFGHGTIVAQLAATLFAGGTAFVIGAIAMRRTTFWPAAAAGVFYLLMLSALGGAITQTSVFYNLFVAVAAWLVLETTPALSGRGDVGRAVLAMALCGLAIQIKTNAVFEGAAIGLWLLARMHSRVHPSVIALRATGFAIVGIAPTVGVGIGFWIAGLFDPWWFANFQSQLLKAGGFGADSLSRLPLLVGQIAPALIVAAFGWRRMPPSPERSLLATWCVLSLADTFAIGNFWAHYALPLLVPTAALGAFVFADRRLGRLMFGIFALWPACSAIVADRFFDAETRRTVAHALSVIPADAPHTCVLGYGVPAAYLTLSHACLVTPYIFIDHLHSSTEARALPVAASVALRQALARRPGTILAVEHSAWKLPNRVNATILETALAKNYRPIARTPLRRWPVDPQVMVVWRRNDLPAR